MRGSIFNGILQLREKNALTHVLFLFQMCVSVFFAFQAFGLDVRRGPERILKSYRRTLWVWTVMLAANALIGYVYFNILGVDSAVLELELVDFS